MEASTLHIVFNPSAGASLRDAMRQIGRNDQVIALPDCLSFGPINPPDPALRCKWVEDQLGYTDWEPVVGESQSFWNEAFSGAHDKVVWTSRRSAQEYCGFLEWLWRADERPFNIVDVTDLEVVHRDRTGKQKPRHLATSVALLPAYQIIENELFDAATPVEANVRSGYQRQWAMLREENAPLRILVEGGIESAPITAFDELVLSHASRDWQKSALVVAKALTDFWDTSLIQTGDLVLASRLRALAGTGQLRARGNLADIQGSEVRRP